MKTVLAFVALMAPGPVAAQDVTLLCSGRFIADVSNMKFEDAEARIDVFWSENSVNLAVRKPERLNRMIGSHPIEKASQGNLSFRDGALFGSIDRTDGSALITIGDKSVFRFDCRPARPIF